LFRREGVISWAKRFKRDFGIVRAGVTGLNQINVTPISTFDNGDSAFDLSSMALTRSKAAALQQATPPQQATATEEDLVTVNWMFFDKSDPKTCMPLSIDVPRARFNGRSQKCQKLFASEILDSLSLSARQNTVKFWKVSGIHHSWCQTH